MHDQYISKQEKIAALEADGYSFNNYDFLDDTENYGQHYNDMMINTEDNEFCASFFDGRTVFTFNETEYSGFTAFDNMSFAE